MVPLFGFKTHFPCLLQVSSSFPTTQKVSVGLYTSTGAGVVPAAVAVASTGFTSTGEDFVTVSVLTDITETISRKVAAGIFCYFVGASLLDRLAAFSKDDLSSASISVLSS